MAGDEIVHGVTNRARDDPGEQSQPPGTTHIAGDSQAGGGSDEHALVGAGWIVDPDHRVNVCDGWVTRADLAAQVAVERRKAQRMLALMPQDELHCRGAESAGAVVQEKRRLIA